MIDFYMFSIRIPSRYFFRILLLVLTLPGFINEVTAQKKYILLMSGGKSGINLDNGTRILPPEFERLGWSDGKFEVVNGLIGFQKGGYWGLISLKGEVIVHAGFGTLIYAGQGVILASVNRENNSAKYGCIDLSGKTLIPFEFDDLKIIRDRVILATSDGKHFRYGVADMRFKTLIAREWRSIAPLHEYFFMVENDKGQKAVFDFNGNRKTSFMTDSVKLMDNGDLAFYQGPMRGVIDVGKTEPQNAAFKAVRISGEGKTEVLQFSKWVMLNGENLVVDKIDADSIRPLSDGTMRIYRNGFTAIISQDLNEPAIGEFKPTTKITGKPEVKKSSTGTGLADENGIWLIRPEYEKIEWDGRVALMISKYEDGTTETKISRPISDGWISPAYDYVKKAGDYFHVKKFGHYGIADRDGREIIPAIYDSLIAIRDKTIQVRYLGKYGLMDFNQKWIEAPQTGIITIVDERSYIVELPNNVKLKDVDGRILYSSPYPLKLNESGEIEEQIPGGIRKCIRPDGNPCLKKSGNHEPAQPKEKPVAELQSNTLNKVEIKEFPETEGLRGFYDNGKFGFKDAKNRIRIANRYDSIRPFSEGKAAIKLLGKWGFINHEDKIVIQPLYSITTDFSNGTSRINKEGKWGIINDHGKEVLQPVYDEMTQQDGTTNFIITAGSMFGLVSSEGRLLIEPRYQYLEPAMHDRYLVKMDFYGVINSAGEPVFPMNYKRLYFIRKRNAFLTEVTTKWESLPGK